MPLPEPARATVSTKTRVKVALTDCAALMVTVQAPVPAHGSLHPENTEPAAAVAARVTTVPAL